ncbi:MAG TPA: hypothetical protein VIL85_00785 [Thermomicrobiales bacterium]
MRAQVEALLRAPEAGLVYGDGVFTDETGAELAPYLTRSFSYGDLLRVNYIMQPTVFIRRAIVERIGPLDLSFGFAMDRDYWLRCSLVTTFLYNPRRIATYRLHRNSKTVQTTIALNIEGFGALCKHLEAGGGRTLGRRGRRHLLARSLVNLAVRAVRADDLPLAARLVRGAFILNRPEPRYGSVLLALLDRATGWDWQPRLSRALFFLLNPDFRHNRIAAMNLGYRLLAEDGARPGSYVRAAPRGPEPMPLPDSPAADYSYSTKGLRSSRIEGR